MEDLKKLSEMKVRDEINSILVEKALSVIRSAISNHPDDEDEIIDIWNSISALQLERRRYCTHNDCKNVAVEFSNLCSRHKETIELNKTCSFKKAGQVEPCGKLLSGTTKEVHIPNLFPDRFSYDKYLCTNHKKEVKACF